MYVCIYNFFCKQIALYNSCIIFLRLLNFFSFFQFLNICRSNLFSYYCDLFIYFCFLCKCANAYNTCLFFIALIITIIIINVIIIIIIVVVVITSLPFFCPNRFPDWKKKFPGSAFFN